MLIDRLSVQKRTFITFWRHSIILKKKKLDKGWLHFGGSDTQKKDIHFLLIFYSRILYTYIWLALIKSNPRPEWRKEKQLTGWNWTENVKPLHTLLFFAPSQLKSSRVMGRHSSHPWLVFTKSLQAKVINAISLFLRR